MTLQTHHLEVIAEIISKLPQPEHVARHFTEHLPRYCPRFDPAKFLKKATLTVAFLASGFNLIVHDKDKEYVWYENLTLEHCVGRLIMERQALKHVQDKFPTMELRYECRPQS